MMHRIYQDGNFINGVLFSDESTFYLHEHKCWMEQVHTEHPQKINVWCGIIGRNIVGPFFISGNCRSERYLQLLQQHIVLRLREIFTNHGNRNIPAETIWFQQDGAPPLFFY
jgi:hypothetical protein